jgi:Ran GTPase-activating protein (RanGAP) involved in mRNA processing and transport
MREAIEKRINAAMDAKDKFVNLERLEIADAELPAIIEKLSKFTVLEVINLSHNVLTCNGAELLGEQLASFTHLKTLDIQFNQIDEKGINAVLALKIEMPGLIIALHGNKIVDEAEMYAIDDRLKSRLHRQ